MKHYHRFEMVEPKNLRVGDIVNCFAHDDQLEMRCARIISIRKTGPGVFHWPSGYFAAYRYRVYLTCRHVNTRHLHGTGGPAFIWHRFNWNTTGRVLLDGQPTHRPERSLRRLHALAAQARNFLWRPDPANVL